VLAHQAKGKNTLGAALAAVGLPRSNRYYRRMHGWGYPEEYDHLREPLERAARQHPAYAYRRTAVKLREAYGHRITYTLVQKLHQAWDLPLMRTTSRQRTSHRIGTRG